MNEIQQIIGNNNHLGLQQIENNAGLQQIAHDPGLQPIEHNGGLQPVELNGSLKKIVYDPGLQTIEPNGGLQPIEHNDEHNASLEQIEHSAVLQQIEHSAVLQQIDHELCLQPIENNGDHLGLQQIDHNSGLQQQIGHNGGLQQIGHNGGHLGLQQIPHVQDPGLVDNLVNLNWLAIFNWTENDEPEPVAGLQPQNGAHGNFNGVGESDEEEEAAHFGEIAELEPELLEDLEPYWGVDNGEEQQNLLNMDPPPDDFFDGVD